MEGGGNSDCREAHTQEETGDNRKKMVIISWMSARVSVAITNFYQLCCAAVLSDCEAILIYIRRDLVFFDFASTFNYINLVFYHSFKKVTILNAYTSVNVFYHR